jgi:DtxR family Mn-dependent transcriptional regulator
MSWAEVHDEAEHLEHAVSDRLIERIDEMLGRPTVDPHGDPIPTAEGHVAQSAASDLLSCPIGVTVRVTRVIDQDPEFLHFVEASELKPGEQVTVDARDGVADRVSLRYADGRVTTVGTRAAAKILVTPSS